MPQNTRRTFLKQSIAATAGLTAPTAVMAAAPTPRAAEGPFYPTKSMRFKDIDNDLVKVAGTIKEAGGEIFWLTGRVLARDGKPVSDARVEIWQVDMNARYIHTGDRGGKSRDEAFQGFGQDITDQKGRYRFRTIKPVAYPGRTPHIHVKALAGDRELITQFYIAEEPLNDRDSLFRRMSRSERESVLMRFHETGQGTTATVDILL